MHPGLLAFSTVFKRAGPLVTLLDVQSLTTDLTTYTFTNCHIGPFSGNLTRQTTATDNDPNLRSSNKGYILVFAHGEDALASFNVTGITIGGVAGTELVDGTGAVAASTALYRWNTEQISAITTTDIAVTFSEATTGCAIGVLYVSNVGVFTNLATGTASGTGDLAISPGNGTSFNIEPKMLLVVGSTCVTGAAAEQPQFFINAQSSHFQPTLLYHGSNAEFDYAAAWTYNPGAPCGELSCNQIACNWSGATNADLVGSIFF